MKYQLKAQIIAVLAISIAALAFAGKDSKPPKHGKDVLHIHIDKRMANAGVVPDARGDVKVELNTEGDKTHQDIHVKLKDLGAATTYQLAAQVGDDTNLTAVIEFTTDDHGNADLDLQDKGKDKPVKEKTKNGHVKANLPAELEPVNGIHDLLILDGDGATVLDADLTAPDKFEYLLKRDLSTDTVRADLKIESNSHKAKVHLSAKGLTAGVDYSLALNGNVADTTTADDNGHVELRTELTNAADIFALNSVALLDADSNTVVSATLP